MEVVRLMADFSSEKTYDTSRWDAVFIITEEEIITQLPCMQQNSFKTERGLETFPDN
jgi:hypothetical protein